MIMPKVTYPDIYNYLISAQSSYTGDQLKAYKDLEAYFILKMDGSDD